MRRRKTDKDRRPSHKEERARGGHAPQRKVTTSVTNEGNATDPVPLAEADVGSSASSGTSLHDLFTQQARDFIERADLDEEQKQNLLVAMSCPCCGGGGLSYTVKLKR